MVVLLTRVTVSEAEAVNRAFSNLFAIGRRLIAFTVRHHDLAGNDLTRRA